MAITPDETDFQRYRRREWLKNERYRETLVAAAFGAFTLVFAVVYFLSLRDFAVFRRHPELLWWTLGVLGLMVLRGFGVRALVGRWLEREAPAPAWLRYANGAFEISAPTAVLAIYLYTFESSIGLLSPALLLYFVFITLSTLELDPALCLFLGALAAAEFFALSFFVGDVGFTSDGTTVYAGWQYFAPRAGILLISGAAAAGAAARINKSVERAFLELRDRARVERLFGQQVSPQIVEAMIGKTDELESELREVCVLFVDIRGFTPFCEGKSSREIVQYQNDVFSFMIDEIYERGGVVNQFMGDGFMATFGAPVSTENDARSAIEAGLAIVREVERRSACGEIPQTRVGVGAHVGQAAVGNVGNSVRRQYSVTGNVVILAARLEQLNKKFDSSALVSREAFERSGLDPAIARPLEPQLLKGRSEPIEVYRLA